ncbi:Facilitated trehalose transporter Tret1 [Melipona quadrifasciata]|uniref:Facilitated trehalose transporter Tret1 n=1 Tax=Melipona quadrifasciata TaxID=166423 RepID=A0A0N0BBK3_9HYME|nr:Facilitated trehalose transporter Tret1 [Melipona quadrifasciata]
MSYAKLYLVTFVGRKISILFTIVPTCPSWLLIAWNPSILNIYVVHFIGGTVSGIIFTSGLTFVTEISPAHIRGALCSCFVLMDYCGDLLGCVIGSFGTVHTYSYVAMSLAMMQFVLFVCCPETPYYLLRQKRLVAAMDSLIFLRGTGDVTEEMDSIMKAVEFDPRSSGILSSLLHLISESEGKAVILIGLAVMLLQALSGPIILIGYARTVFEKNLDVQLHGTAEITNYFVLATVYLISYLMCIGLVDRLGRRPLMIISAVGVSSCNFFLAIYSYVEENAIDTTNLQSLFFVTVLLYTINVSLGLASIPFVVTNEIFPTYARATYKDVEELQGASIFDWRINFLFETLTINKESESCTYRSDEQVEGMRHIDKAGRHDDDNPGSNVNLFPNVINKEEMLDTHDLKIRSAGVHIATRNVLKNDGYRVTSRRGKRVNSREPEYEDLGKILPRLFMASYYREINAVALPQRRIPKARKRVSSCIVSSSFSEDVQTNENTLGTITRCSACVLRKRAVCNLRGNQV